MHVVLSAAMSVDGCIDDTSAERLVLSDAADLDRVDAVRAASDAILVGANTVRRDDPRLRVRSAERVAARVAAGRPAQPLRVVLSGRGDLDPSAGVLGPGTVVYTARPERPRLDAEIVDAGDPLDLHRVLADLAGRGVQQLMVEGGTAVHTLFLSEGCADEIQLVVAPFFVGEAGAPRFVGAGALPRGLRLAEARPMGDHVLLRYLVPPGRPDGDRAVSGDRELLARAVALAGRCPPSATAFSVGALVVGPDGRVLAEGWSRRRDPHDHAEESALADLGGVVPPGSTVYSSLEPCGARGSRKRTCADLIIAAGIRRVVHAWREPPVFVVASGADRLRAAGVEVVEIPELADAARAPNAHLRRSR